MKTLKLKLHSSVDLITNSSTVIFTYSGGSLKAVEELVNEMLKVFDRTETFNDLFFAGVFIEDADRYAESEECPEGTDVEQLIDDILTQKITKPEWMKTAETDRGDYESYRPSTSLYLKPKDDKYKELTNKLLNYLYSTYHEASYDG